MMLCDLKTFFIEQYKMKLLHTIELSIQWLLSRFGDINFQRRVARGIKTVNQSY